MKAKLIYGAIFGGAFVVVTAAIIFLNSTFNNIFQFDFSPPQVTQASLSKTNRQQTGKTGAGLVSGLNSAKPDSTFKNATRDTVFVAQKVDNSFLDSLKILQNKVALLEKQNNNKVVEQKPKDLKAQIKKEDSLRTAAAEIKKIDSKKLEQWAKETAKLYESMDPKKAAKIIQSYSDNESREVIFKMNKKKAAKILSELDPATALRITKAL